ncbi:MAG TPA: hypothetical protein VK014_11090 [Cyclobacteriaceae bacterium]|nr:hypothetical protein [Cyclobacteriaceae bacterium]
MKFFSFAYILFFLILSAQAQQTEKTTLRSKHPNVKEIFYVLKGTNIKHGEYHKTCYGVIKVSEKGRYNNGVKTGIWEYYDQKGAVEHRYDFSRHELLYEKDIPHTLLEPLNPY